MEQIFKDNPKLDVAYKTADGKFFFLENDARNHATNLENKKVIKVERTEEIPSSDTELKEDTSNEDVKELEDEAKEVQQEPNTEAVEPVSENEVLTTTNKKRANGSKKH